MQKELSLPVTSPLHYVSFATRRSKRGGFSMIEILVSIVVLTVGLLGMALLQNTSLRFNQDAYLRSAGLNQLYNISDRMRANPEGVNFGYYDFTSGMPTSTPSCSPCTAQQIAQSDAYTWNQDNAAYLPNGTGTIEQNGTRYTLTVKWDRRRTSGAGAVCGPNPDTDLTCITMEFQQ